ncbi:MAG: GFA family protein [Myxococcales bacterium]|nr:MAG: GFA family protein [Myxococcales bacterium]
MTTRHHGSCLCGAVRFEVEGSFERFFLCHCSFCRKDTGSAHAANLFSTTAKLTWLTGESEVTTYHLPASRHAKSFCKTCGSALPRVAANAAALIVPAGSLESPTTIRPNAHIFVASRADWDRELETVPMLDRLPS